VLVGLDDALVGPDFERFPHLQLVGRGVDAARTARKQAAQPQQGVEHAPEDA